jgi:truncated hemoglobin YjbI
MRKFILRSFTMSLGLGLLSGCPGDVGNTETDPGSESGESSGTTEDNTTPPNTTPPDPTTDTPTTEGPTTDDPTTEDPTTEAPTTATTTEGPTTDPTTETETETESTTGEPDNLCTRLGGHPDGISQLVGGFIGIVVNDQRINGYFLNSDVDAANLVTQVTDQLGEAAGCEGVVYGGLDMKTAHAGLKISTIDFTDFAEDFSLALDDHQQNFPITDDDKNTILTVLGGMLGDIVEDPDDNATVYQRVGRKPAIVDLIGTPDDPESFVGVVAQNAAINSFFANSNFARLNTCLSRQVGGLDGPIKYGLEVDSPGPGIDEGVAADAPCLDMVTSHENLQDADMTFITVDDFGALVGDLVTAMTTKGVTDADQQIILGALGPLCDQIVVGADEKNKCPGNAKTETVEATGLATEAPDGAYNGSIGSMFCQTLTVSDDVDGVNFVNSVELEFGATSTWVGDLTIKVVSPANEILTVVNRPGTQVLPDDGTGCCGEDSDLNPGFPLTFNNDGPAPALDIGKGLTAMQVACKDDMKCEFAPDHGMGPGLDFDDFRGDDAVGDWQVCVGDSVADDKIIVDTVRLNFGKVKFDPTP